MLNLGIGFQGHSLNLLTQGFETILGFYWDKKPIFKGVFAVSFREYKNPMNFLRSLRLTNPTPGFPKLTRPLVKKNLRVSDYLDVPGPGSAGIKGERINGL